MIVVGGQDQGYHNSDVDMVQNGIVAALFTIDERFNLAFNGYVEHYPDELNSRSIQKVALWFLGFIFYKIFGLLTYGTLCLNSITANRCLN